MLFHLQHQALEVFALGMVDVDGVVGGLVELVEYSYKTVALGGCRKDCKAELLFADGLRATECE